MTKTALSRCLGVNYVFEGHYNSYSNYFIGKKIDFSKELQISTKWAECFSISGRIIIIIIIIISSSSSSSSMSIISVLAQEQKMKIIQLEKLNTCNKNTQKCNKK